MDIDFSRALQDFDKVWRRVQQHKPRGNAPHGRRPQPPRGKPKGRANRFNPGHR